MTRYLGTLLAGAATAIILWMIELARLARGSALSQQRLSLWDGPAVDLGLQFVLPALATGGVVLLITALRDLARNAETWRRLVAPALAMPLTIWLGFELSSGTGIQRSGLTSVVVLGTPLILTAGLYVAVLIVERVADRWTRTAALLVLLAVVVLGWANRNLHVGRYRPVHDFLALFEFILLAGGIMLFFGRNMLHRRSVFLSAAAALIGAALVAQCVQAWPITPIPRESLRRVYGRDGFHSERLLYWRARLRPVGPPVTETDDELLAAIRSWQQFADDYQRTLDTTIPDRRAYNLLWISVDTLRPDRLGCYGAPSSKTPFIDSIAAEGTVFRNAYSQYPSTNLSSESMFYGRYPRATAIYRQIKGDIAPEDLRALRLSALAQQNGMRTAASIAFTEEWMTSPVFERALRDYEFINHGRTGRPSLDGEHFADSAIATLDRIKANRFFMWFHLFDPHHPYELREKYAQNSSAEGRYDSEVSYADAQIGRVVTQLKEQGLWDKTIIVINSDHGEAFGEQGLNYHGSSLQEAQVRIPLVIRVPGCPPSSQELLAENVDLYATLASLLGFEGTSENQGTDLSPVIVEPGVHNDRYPDIAYAELPDDVKELSSTATRTAAVRIGRWKLRKQLLLGYTELYDVVSDPGETNNVVGDHPRRAKRLERAIHTMAAWTDGFGRGSTSAEIRRRKIQSAISQLTAKLPMTVGGGLRYVAQHDLFELRGRILDLAGREGMIDEIRCESLSLAAGWNAPGWRDMAADWVFSESPVYRWQALSLIFEDLALKEYTKTPVWDQGVVRNLAEHAKLIGRSGSADALLARAFVALAVRTSGVRASNLDAIEDWQGLLRTPRLPSEMKRRIVLAFLDEIPDLTEYLDYFKSAREQRDLLQSVWRAGRRRAWFEIVRVLIPDRYLGEPIKHDILRIVTNEFPRSVQSEVGLHLLARWDPGFHAEATRKLSDRLGSAFVELLQEAHAAYRDGEELLAGGHAKDAIVRYDRVLELLGNSPASRAVSVRRIEALMLAGRQEDAARALTEFRPADSGFASPALERRIQVLRRYQPTKGPLSERLDIRVTEVAVEKSARRYVPVNGRFEVAVGIANHSERALPSGGWALGGRARVLWKRADTERWTYGTEVELEKSVLPGEETKLRFEIRAPREPGPWIGRIILYQQDGARFHLVEDARGLFTIDTRRDVEGPPGGEWQPAELARHFSFDAELKEPTVQPDGSLQLLARGYEGAFRSPPLGFRGRSRRIRIEFDWLSAVDKANLIRIDLIPAEGFQPVKETILEIKWDGSRQVVETDLPSCTGLYQLEFRVGYRQGDLKIHSLAIL